MNLNDNILIENFLRNKLSKEEITLFKERLNTDTNFKKYFEFEKELFKNLNNEEWDFTKKTNPKLVEEYTKLFQHEDVKELKETLKQETENFKKNNSSVISLKKIFLSISAVFILFFVVNKFILPNNSPKKLYVSYLKNTEIPSLTHRGNTNKNLSIAQNLFEQKKYKKALSILKNVDSKILVLLYIGISQMELDKFKEAENTFNSIINNKNLNTTKGLWFKALLYLKMNRVSDAKYVLQKINKTDYKYTEAQEILNKLGRLD